MKVLKWILIILVAIVAIFLVYSSMQPNKLELEESTVIEAPASAVFAEISDFNNWDQWSAWSKMDPNMEQEITGEPGKLGHKNSWSSENPMVGKGSQEIVEVEENAMIKTKMNFNGDPRDNFASFKLVEEAGVTTVSWDMAGAETPFYMRFMNTLMLPMVRDSYKKSLNDLKELVESKPAEEMVENPFNLEMKDAESIKVISIKDSTDAAGISEKLKELYTEISIFMSTKGIESAGMPLALYYSYSEEKVVLEAAIPYNSDNEIEVEGRVMATETPAGKALFGLHYGDYNASEKMHMAMEKYMNDSGLEMNGPCWEIYANDPTTVDSAEVETHIYYPVN